MITTPLQMALWSTPIQNEIEVFSNLSPEERGAIFTKPEIVEFMLDEAGFSTNIQLFKKRILEPSCGEGDFVIPIAKRLFSSYLNSPRSENDFNHLKKSLCAIELSISSLNICADRLKLLCLEFNFNLDQTKSLIQSWLINSEFLSFNEISADFDYIFGNPPYIRYDKLPTELKIFCKNSFSTFSDRGDLFVPFFQKSLSLLNRTGRHCFICSNRWMKAQYGEKLRSFIVDGFSVLKLFDVENADVFKRKVSAYPAISIISKERYDSILYKKCESVNDLLGGGISFINISAESINASPWFLGDVNIRLLMSKLENFPLITESCKIGIGVASGADKIFIGNFKDKLEQECILPIIKSKNICDGVLQWSNEYIINPFNSDGTPLNLKKYPLLSQYLKKNEITIRNRTCAKKNPNFWFKTIDRINKNLTYKNKILIPDIKCDSNSIIVENGKYYPHHNIYWMIPTDWDIDYLVYVLKNGLAAFYVKTLSNKINGGYYRFQAQYLKKIRLPAWESVSIETKNIIKRGISQLDDTNNLNLYKSLFNLSNRDAELILKMK